MLSSAYRYYIKNNRTFYASDSAIFCVTGMEPRKSFDCFAPVIEKGLFPFKTVVHRKLCLS